VALRAQTGGPSFGRLLRHWRQARGLSQLALALEAEVSSRHVSFLETGRTQPSRDMVERLGAVLDLPLDERNPPALAAGYAPAYAERKLGAPELAHAAAAPDRVLPSGGCSHGGGRGATRRYAAPAASSCSMIAHCAHGILLAVVADERTPACGHDAPPRRGSAIT
jgi:transcriptional regulator with XRE-family HTH domain